MMSSSSSLTLRRFYRWRSTIDTIPSRTFSSTIQNQDTTTEERKQTKKSPLLTNNNELSAIVNLFPTTGLDYAFGYGSGVLKQQSSSAGMVDVILAVDDTYEWHKQNLEAHPHHYSGFARVGGARFVHWMQNLGARLYFHPFVDVDINITSDDGIDVTNQHPTTIQREIKYGIVSTDDLIEDLTCWKYLYLAGRMHKPTVEIDLITNTEHEEQSKVVNRRDEIAEAQQQNLLAARSGILTKDDVKLEIDFNDIAMRKQLIQNLPNRLQLDEIVGVKDSILQGSKLLRAELARIVAPAAKSQSIKGFFSAGVSKSFKYAMAKFAKGRLKK
eukprot:scaffold6334_cov139-Skeletonema_menzelii.AAC.7